MRLNPECDEMQQSGKSEPVPVLTRVRSKTFIVTGEAPEGVPSMGAAVKGLLKDWLKSGSVFAAQQKGFILPGTWTQSLAMAQ